MYKTIPINYVYMSSATQEKFEAAINIAGWGKSVILTQIAQTYGKVHDDYYSRVAELDAKARGFEQHKGDHFDMLSDWKELPPYADSRPIFEPSPLASIPNPDRSLPRYSFSQFRCSARNAAILRLALVVEQTNMQVLMSKMFVWYYSKYWPLYLPQLASVEQRTISPDMSELS